MTVDFGSCLAKYLLVLAKEVFVKRLVQLLFANVVLLVSLATASYQLIDFGSCEFVYTRIVSILVSNLWLGGVWLGMVWPLVSLYCVLPRLLAVGCLLDSTLLPVEFWC